jgi:hypothetical protein
MRPRSSHNAQEPGTASEDPINHAIAIGSGISRICLRFPQGSSIGESSFPDRPGYLLRADGRLIRNLGSGRSQVVQLDSPSFRPPSVMVKKVRLESL